MTTYQLVKDKDIELNIVKRSDGAFIPFDLANTDYQEYLKWLELGNLPSPADIVEPSQASVTPSPAEENN